MTTTELINLLQQVEKGASGRSRKIRIYTKDKKGVLEKTVIKETDKLEIVSTSDGISGAELSLVINTFELDDKIARGLITNDLEPIKCECGCTSFRDVIASREDTIIYEYDRFCKSCKALMGSWAHGSWIP